jgi:uncharacterized protein YbgA (DUF1722 family)/uncharacterized protein YbbK (DUF523 family)
MREFVKPTLFVSACIEFEECRYDGTMISDQYVKRLKESVNVVRVCPELAIGLSSPRDALRLVERKGETRKLLSTNKGVDHTEKMIDFSKRYANNLLKKEVDGFLMKAKSPTCGVTDVKVYHDIGKAHTKSGKNIGMFAEQLKAVFPTIPMESERRISNYRIRDRFFIELFTSADFRLTKKTNKMRDLVAFHTKNKYLFMTYNQTVLKKMGQIVANAAKLLTEEVLEKYEELLRVLLSKEPTIKKRINVLTHIYGYFKRDVQAEEKEYYFDLLDDYLNSKVPYSTILSLLKSWVVRFQQEYLLPQTIFEPYPKELIMVTDSGKQL